MTVLDMTRVVIATEKTTRVQCITMQVVFELLTIYRHVCIHIQLRLTAGIFAATATIVPCVIVMFIT